MKVGVIADTHLREASPELEELMAGPFKDVQMVLHTGDITELAVLQAFAGKEIQAVCGNMDSPAVRRQLPTQHILRVGKFKIGLIHGWGGPQGIEERIRQEALRVDPERDGGIDTTADGQQAAGAQVALEAVPDPLDRSPGQQGATGLGKSEDLPTLHEGDGADGHLSCYLFGLRLLIVPLS